jgi:hypothetical protein
MRKKNILKGAGILLIALAMVFSSIVIAETNEVNAVCLTNERGLNQVNQIYEKTNANICWDQYDTDGSNGLSNAPRSAFGYQRALLDDFEIPDGEEWIITDFHMLGLWNSLQPPQGQGFNLSFWSDNAGVPGIEIVKTVQVSYTETRTGRVWFTRNEFEVDYQFEPVTLGEGRYWIWGHIYGPENCFWMGRLTIWGTEAYCDFEDYPPLQPGSNIFGDPYDLAYRLTCYEDCSDIACKGSITWNDVGVPPGSTQRGQFEVCNSGCEGSSLCWEVLSWPTWGNWTFNPSSGSLVAPNCETVDVSCVIPNVPETEFTGEIIVKNCESPDETCRVPVYLKTPKVKENSRLSFLQMLFERFPNAFPMLRQLLGM